MVLTVCLAAYQFAADIVGPDCRRAKENQINIIAQRIHLDKMAAGHVHISGFYHVVK